MENNEITCTKLSAKYDKIKYKNVDYWNKRYMEEESFEWCKSYKYFKDLIGAYINKNDRILILGCGNSKLSNDLYNDGYRSITSLDFSPIAVQKAANRRGSTQMEWLMMDINKLMFRPGSFDVVLEKATIDSLLVDEDDVWNLSSRAKTILTGILTQVSNLLEDGGLFVSLTFAQPHFRRKIYGKTRYNWSLEYLTYGDGFHFFFYVMQKGRELQGVYRKEEEQPNLEEDKEVKRQNLNIVDEDEGEDADNFLSKLSELAIDLNSSDTTFNIFGS